MADMIGFCKGDFSAPFGLQINLSCPNTGHDPHELIGESAKVLEIASSLGVPIMPKYSIASAPIKAVFRLNDHPYCDAICVSNTLPFGWQGIDWKSVWGSTTSPLAKLGGGGLSGKTLRPLVCEWIMRLRDAGLPSRSTEAAASCARQTWNTTAMPALLQPSSARLPHYARGGLKKLSPRQIA